MSKCSLTDILKTRQGKRPKKAFVSVDFVGQCWNAQFNGNCQAPMLREVHKDLKLKLKANLKVAYTPN